MSGTIMHIARQDDGDEYMDDMHSARQDDGI